MLIPLAERLTRLEQWFDRRNDRPLLGFYLGEVYPLHRYRQGVRRLPAGLVRPEDVIVEDYLAEEEQWRERHEAAGGDLVPAVAPFWGLPWAEAALGCGVVADPVAGATRAVPPPGFADHPQVPDFDPDHPWVRKYLEFASALAARSGGRYPVGVSLMRGVSDLLSALYGGEAFIYRLIDRPDEVRAVIEAVTRFWIEFGRCVLAHTPPFRGGTGAFFYGLWTPGRTIWTQEDAAALLSPTLYEEFIFPAVCRIAAAFEHVVIHLHPSQFLPVDYLLRTPIRVLELHLDVGGPRAADLEPVYRAILAQRPLLVWGDVTPADLEFLLTRLPAAGLAINVCVDSVEQAEAVWARAAAWWSAAGATGPAAPVR